MQLIFLWRKTDGRIFVIIKIYGFKLPVTSCHTAAFFSSLSISLFFNTRIPTSCNKFPGFEAPESLHHSHLFLVYADSLRPGAIVGTPAVLLLLLQKYRGRYVIGLSTRLRLIASPRLFSPGHLASRPAGCFFTSLLARQHLTLHGELVVCVCMSVCAHARVYVCVCARARGRACV